MSDYEVTYYKNVVSTWLLTVTAILFVVAGRVGAAPEHQLATLQIDNHRPLDMAIYELRIRHGLVITYEDPRYVRESELIDITEDFPGAKKRFEEGLGPRLIAPGRGRLELTYPVLAGGAPEDPAALLRDLIEVHNAAGNPGRFELRQEGETFHVVPVATKNKQGKLRAQQPLMDTWIDLPQGERSGDEAVVTLVETLLEAVGVEISIGMLPGLREKHTVEIEAMSGSAREVLTRILAAAAPAGDRFTWGLYFNPTTDAYMLAVSPVRRTDLSRP